MNVSTPKISKYQVRTYTPKEIKVAALELTNIENNKTLNMEIFIPVFKTKENDIIEMIFYKDMEDDKEVDESYTYLVEGPVYKIEGSIIYVSIGGMLMDIDDEEMARNLSDKNFLMIGMKIIS